MNVDYQYSCGDIIIEPYKFDSILYVSLSREMNEHGKLFVKGIIKEESLDDYVEQANDNSKITFALRNEDGSEKILFRGIVSNIEVIVESGTRILVIEALSNSFYLDITKNSRTFQSSGYSYNEILNIINSNYKNAEVSEDILNNVNVDKMIVQYKETDWEFIKRITSHFNAMVIAECQLNDIKYSLGTSESDEVYILDEMNYTIKKNLHQYRILNKEVSISEINTISYEVYSNKILNLGNKVKFQGRDYYIFSVEIRSDKGILKNKYILKDKKGMMIKKYFNNKISGTSLNGKVSDIKNDEVKVNLEIDGGNSEKKQWLPYSTVFSSEDGTGWYCMPEVGDNIRLYFPDNDEKNGYVISSVNVQSKDSNKRSDPSVKSIGTKYGKEVVMKEGAVEIVGNGDLLMRLTDDGGIEIKSNKKIVLDAKEEIEINGGTSIMIIGEESVDLKQGNAELKIQDDVTLTGGKVNIE